MGSEQQFKMPSISDIIPMNYAYSAHTNTMLYGYMYLMEKYKSRCYIPGELFYNEPRKQLSYSIAEKESVKPPIEIGDEIVKCISGNSPIIFIPLSLVFTSVAAGHHNLLIYRPFKKVIELFEPGNPIGLSDLNRRLKKLFEVTLEPMLGQYTPTFVPPISSCPRHRVGLQELEHLYKYEENETGYCQIWCLFIMECILMNPEMNTEDIIDNCFQVADTKPDVLRNLIRGYVTVLTRAIKMHAQFNIRTGKHSPNEETVDSDENKQRLTQKSIKTADLFQKLRTSPTRKISIMERTTTKKLNTLEKNLGLINKCSDQTKKRLCTHFHLNEIHCKQELMKFVIKTPIPVKTFKQIIRDLPKNQEPAVQETSNEEEFFYLLNPLPDEKLQTLYAFYKIKKPTFTKLILHLSKSQSAEYLKKNLEGITFEPSPDNAEHQKIIKFLDSTSEEGLEWLFKKHLPGNVNKNWLIYYYLNNGGTKKISDDMQFGSFTGFFGA